MSTRGGAGCTTCSKVSWWRPTDPRLAQTPSRANLSPSTFQQGGASRESLPPLPSHSPLSASTRAATWAQSARRSRASRLRVMRR